MCSGLTIAKKLYNGIIKLIHVTIILENKGELIMSKDRGAKKEVKKPKKAKPSKAPNSSNSNLSKPIENK